MRRILFVTGLALAAITTTARADIIYDSSSVYLWGTPNQVATSGFNDNITTHPTQPYLAQSVLEVGGHVGITGSARTAQEATIQMRTGPNGSAAIPGTIAFTLNFYSNLGSSAFAFATDTITVNTPAGTGTTKTTQRPFYEINFDLRALNLQLPDDFYYGLSFDSSANVTANSTNISLWNYGTAPGFGPADSDYDGATIKTGTDLDHAYWSKLTNGSYVSTSGFTPNLTLQAVPEPASGALLLSSLGMMIAYRRRRR